MSLSQMQSLDCSAYVRVCGLVNEHCEGKMYLVLKSFRISPNGIVTVPLTKGSIVDLDIYSSEVIQSLIDCGCLALSVPELKRSVPTSSTSFSEELSL